MSLLDKASLIVTPNAYKESKLYSVIPSNGDGDMTVVRATSATRVNKDGLIETVSVLGSELVVNGDFATDSDWVKQTGWSISGGNAIAVNVPNTQRLQSNGVSSVIGKTYKYSFEASNISGFYTVYIYGLTVLSSINTEGLIEGTFVATSTNGAFYISGATLSGLTTGKFDNVSVKEVITSNIPRIDYTGGGCPSILVEPQRTNLVFKSEPTSTEVVDSNVSYESFSWANGFTNCVRYLDNLVNRYRRVGTVLASTEYTFHFILLWMI